VGHESADRASLGRGAWRVLQSEITRGVHRDLLFIILANIGTTITPWQIFFQQSSVVDKGMDIHDIKFGRLDTWIGSFATCVVAIFIIIATAAVLYYHDPRIIIEDVKQCAEAFAPLLPEGQVNGRKDYLL